MTNLSNFITTLKEYQNKYGDIPISFSEIDPYIEGYGIKTSLETSDNNLYIGISI